MRPEQERDKYRALANEGAEGEKREGVWRWFALYGQGCVSGARGGKRMDLRVVVRCALVGLASVWLSGCSEDFGKVPASTSAVLAGPLTGSVHGGQQPVVGASVSLYAASNAGYGAASILLTPVPAITDANGSFSVTGTYTCTPGQQVYLVASGGNPGVAPSVANPVPTNPASAMMGVLGTCPAAGTFAQTLPFLQVNEVSTIAAAYALAPFAVDVTHVGSANTTQSLNGLANAFVNAGKIYDITGAHGQGATKASPIGIGILPQALINTLADIISACVNTVQTYDAVGGIIYSAPCMTLLGTAISGGNDGTSPKETATAAINIAHHPGLHTATLLSLVTASAPFQPTQSGVTDLALYVVYLAATPKQIGIDSQGSIFYNYFCTNTGSSVLKLSNAGVVLSPPSGYSAGALESCGYGITVDQSDNVWTDARPTTSTQPSALVFEFSNTGTLLSPASGFPTGLISPDDLTTDPSGNIWTADLDGSTVVELAPNGNILSPSALQPPINLPGYQPGGINMPYHLASDMNGNIWIASYNALTEINNQGQALTPANGITTGGLAFLQSASLGIDNSNNVWVASSGANSVVKVSSNGTVLSPSNGYTAPSLASPAEVAIDGDGNVFVNNAGPGGLTEFSNTGAQLSGMYGFTGGGILYNNTISSGMSSGFGIQVDSSGDVWTVEVSGQVNNFVLNDNALYEFIGIAAPAVTPLSLGVKNHTLGTRP